MNLTPFVSTHLRLLVNNIEDCTVGEVYCIEKWRTSHNGVTYYQIKDDTRCLREWYHYENDPEVEDASYEANLQNILSE